MLATEWQEESGINYSCVPSSPVEGLARLKRAMLATADGCSRLRRSSIALPFFRLGAGMLAVLLWRLEPTAEYLCFRGGEEENWPGSQSEIFGAFLW